ncbi:MAG: hypothetical protein A2031_09075 [Deltaproteobacteria bacterium RBG_19FT_COMBO_43_11]|nr:MAG: hypothetical protein A2031_09075 [Deltaproteobacteria bacterium RBG_19FT_COMBO_43_11]
MPKKRNFKSGKNNIRLPKANLNQKNALWPWLIMAIIILFTAVIRIRLLQIPLERDEGEFAYMGQLMLQGIPPYLMAYAQKLPGIYSIYALIMAIFGQTIAGIHLGLLVANCIATLLLFFLTRRLFDNVAAIVTAAGYALLSLSPSVLGTSAHATQFIVPFALGGTILLLKFIDSDKYLFLFMSGLLYGLAFIIKQHAVFFIIFAMVYLTLKIIAFRPVNWERLITGNLILATGSILTFLLTCVILYWSGVFYKFWFWTFVYSGEYISIITFADALHNFMASIARVINYWELLWIIAGIGLTTPFWYKKARSNSIFLFGFFFFSFLTVCPGFFFRPHYFVTLLPAITLLAGVAVSASVIWLSEKKISPIVHIIPAFVIVLIIISSVSNLGDFFFKATPVEACRILYGDNPFPEAVEIGKYIKNHTKKEDFIVVVGSEPELYFYADRKSATGHIYTYRLMRTHKYASKMQLDMIKEIETARPKYAVLVTIPSSWLSGPDSDFTIINWAQTYFNKNYTLVELVTSVAENQYKIYWDEEARKKQLLSPFNIFVMKRISPQ